jgi:hypothetical protein
MERYCCLALGLGKLYQIRIFHEPWTLREAILKSHWMKQVNGGVGQSSRLALFGASFSLNQRLRRTTIRPTGEKQIPISYKLT